MNTVAPVTDDRTELEKAVSEITVEYSAEFVPFSKSRHSGNKQPDLNWILTIGREKFVYSAGVGHISNEKVRAEAMKRNRSIDGDAEARQWCEYGRLLRVDCRRATFNQACVTQTPPPLADVLYCLLSDSSALDMTFEEFASDFGYDEDSRSAEKIYNECREGGYKLIRVIGAMTVEQLRHLEH